MMKNVVWLSSLILFASVFTGTVNAAENTVERELKFAAGQQIEVDNMRGKVTIIGWDRDIARVTGEVDEQAEEFIFEVVGDTLVMKTKMPSKVDFNRGDSSNLTLHIPHRSDLVATGVSSDFAARELEGTVRIATVSGGIVTTKVQGELRLESVSGKIVDQGSMGKRGRYNSVSGNVEISTAILELAIESVSGDIELSAETLNELDMSSVSGDVMAQLTLAHATRVNGSSVSGDIELHLSGSVDATLDINTSAGGDINNGLSEAQATKTKYGPNRTLVTQIGQGNARILLTTVGGDISLKR